MTSPRKTNHNAGFTLLELVAALFVFAVGLLGTVQMYNVLAGKLLHVQESEIAARALNAEIETLRSLPFSQLTNREDASFVSQPYGTENLVNLTTRLTIRPYPDSGLNLKQITATVLWTGEHGRKIEKSATTLITNKEART
ncbi:MAG: prepilin-type N-terminal cleavage/methylation domain-containing protein [Candidatus Hydrogenedentes bacterium]|nr:prepilin-type N-terminal cleavage/methylation domain-containing protein [Candidatus Hydrogenedentota bacterium]